MYRHFEPHHTCGVCVWADPDNFPGMYLTDDYGNMYAFTKDHADQMNHYWYRTECNFYKGRK